VASATARAARHRDRPRPRKRQPVPPARPGPQPGSRARAHVRSSAGPGAPPAARPWKARASDPAGCARGQSETRRDERGRGQPVQGHEQGGKGRRRRRSRSRTSRRGPGIRAAVSEAGLRLRARRDVRAVRSSRPTLVPTNTSRSRSGSASAAGPTATRPRPGRPRPPGGTTAAAAASARTPRATAPMPADPTVHPSGRTRKPGPVVQLPSGQRAQACERRSAHGDHGAWPAG
jgi:hypothetical protein